MTLKITTDANKYCLREPAHRYWQGERCVYYFALDLQTLDGLLPQRMDDHIVKDANRQLTQSHARDIQNYLRDRNDWLLGAMLLGISQKAVEFESYEDENGQRNINFGELRILANLRNTMQVFDGQHRRRAIGDLLRELSEDEENGDISRDSLLQAAVPIALYEEEDLRSLRTMFADASKTKRIEASTVTRFDQRNAFNLAAVHLSEKSRLFGGRIEMERTTVAANSKSLLSINQLAADLKALDVGIDGRVSRERNIEHMQNLDELYQRCLTWADDFLPTARNEYAELLIGGIEDNEISALRRRSLAFSATFIRILAGCYQHWLRRVSDDWEPLAYYVNDAVLTPGGGYGSLLVDAGAMAPGDSSLVSRRQEVQGAINYIVAEARKTA